MNKEIETTIGIKETITNKDGLIKLNQVITLECLNCGTIYETYNDHRNDITKVNEHLKEILTDYIDNGFNCEDCQKGESE